MGLAVPDRIRDFIVTSTTVNRFNTRIVKKDKNWAMKPVAFTLCPFRVKPSFATGREVYEETQNAQEGSGPFLRFCRKTGLHGGVGRTIRPLLLVEASAKGGSSVSQIKRPAKAWFHTNEPLTRLKCYDRRHGILHAASSNRRQSVL